MLVRRYEPRDFDDCDWLQRSFYKFPASQEELHGKLEHPSWVALDQSWNGASEVIGNIITCPYWKNGAESVLIWSIVVAGPYRGYGTGSSLMDAAERSYHGKSVMLFVEPTNRAAQFYRKRGYHEVQLWPGYYGDGSPAIEMVKNL